MPSFTTIPDGDVDVDSPITTALMTALRDNPEGIAQRVAGAPKIFGVPYNVQIFAASGTWTKPSNAETDDIVLVWGVGGGGSGAEDASVNQAGGGSGGFGGVFRFDDIDDLAATEAVTIGAGASTNTSTDGSDGGDTIFGTPSTDAYLVFGGGPAGQDNSAENAAATFSRYLTSEGSVRENRNGDDDGKGGWADTDATNRDGRASRYGGGGGGTNLDSAVCGFSMYGGRGGHGASSGTGEAGQFPGGGGAGAVTNGGAGGDGYMIVYCMKES